MTFISSWSQLSCGGCVERLGFPAKKKKRADFCMLDFSVSQYRDLEQPSMRDFYIMPKWKTPFAKFSSKSSSYTTKHKPNDRQLYKTPLYTTIYKSTFSGFSVCIIVDLDIRLRYRPVSWALGFVKRALGLICWRALSEAAAKRIAETVILYMIG